MGGLAGMGSSRESRDGRLDGQMTEISKQLRVELAAIVGSENVISRPEDLLVYECDAYTIEKNLPSVVVLPRSSEEVARVVRACAREQAPIIPRGAGTSLSGAVLAVEGGVMIALTRMNRVLQVDYENRRALVEAGCVNASITKAVKGRGLLYAPDPSSQSACTIGGNVATNSGGPHTLKYGVTTNHVLGMELVLPSGEIVWLGTAPEGGEEVDGYDLRGAVIGSEGMFGIVTRVLVKLVRAPQAFKTMLGIFEGIPRASETVSEIIGAGIVPAALEMMDQMIVQAVESAYQFGFPLDAGAVLIIELDGFSAGLDRQAERVLEICHRNGAREVRLARTEEERALLWKCRKRAFGAVGRLSPNYLTQDGVVPRSKLPQIMEFISGASAKYGLRITNVFHAGDGNIHPLILYDERDPEQTRKAIQAGEDILERCIELGGSVTGEHGIGVEKMDFMARQFTPVDLNAMRTLRLAFDPGMRCNPHKMFPGSKRCGDFAMRKQVAA
jgi:glycolate oxidase